MWIKNNKNNNKKPTQKQMDSLLSTGLAFVYILIYIAKVQGQCGSSRTHSTTASSTSLNYITSANYPSYYDNYIYCTSTITNSGAGQILFHVDFQDIEPRYDFLKIYTGSITTSNMLHHSEDQGIDAIGLTNVGDDLVVRFTTDSSVTYGGYKVEFIEVVNLQSCGNSITATSTEQQLSYVESWHTASPCQWTITAQDPTHAVEIRIIFVDGYLRIREANVETDLNTAEDTYVSGQHALSIQIVGYSSNNFILTYKSNNTNSGAGAVTVATGQPTIDDTSSVCYESVKTATSTIRQLNSPNYPSSYPNNINCDVLITADDPSQSVSLDIVDLALQYNDNIKIYDGSSAVYTELAVTTTDVIVSSSDGLIVRFQTNDFGQDRGFNLTYTSVLRIVPTCTNSLQATLTADATQQTLQSPNYPNHYENNVDLYWLITKPTVSSRIVLDFRDFHLEIHSLCTYDYVAIFDGSCTSDVRLAKICGDNTAKYEDQTGLYILIHFHTDSSVTDIGWSLTYYIGTYQDPDGSDADEDSGSEIPSFVYAVIGVGTLIIIVAVAFVFLYMQNNERRVGVSKDKPEVKRRTVKSLMHEIEVNVLGPPKNHKSTSKVNVINRSPLPPPPQNLPPLFHDPVYPPIDYRYTGAQMPTQNIVPAIPKGGSLQPYAPFPPNTSGSSMIPAAYSYMSPSDARNAGIYG